jgi:hypothetical protein
MFSEIEDNENNLWPFGEIDSVMNGFLSDADFFQISCLDDSFPTSYFPSDTLCTLSDEVETTDVSVPSDVHVNRKDWLVEDKMSKRMRSPRLYEFLILLLRKSDFDFYASFTDREKGIFHISKPEKVAELWQAVKSRQSHQKMTYDKFARAVRWYYKSNIMQKTNTRYTFQFSPRIMNLYFFDENNNDVIAPVNPTSRC